MIRLVARDLRGAVELFNDDGASPFVEECELRERPDEIRAREQGVRSPVRARDGKSQASVSGCGKALQLFGKLD